MKYVIALWEGTAQAGWEHFAPAAVPQKGGSRDPKNTFTVAAGCRFGARPAESRAREGSIPESRRRHSDRWNEKAGAGHGGHDLQFWRVGIPGDRDVQVSNRYLGKRGIPSRAWSRRHSYCISRDLGA